MKRIAIGVVLAACGSGAKTAPPAPPSAPPSPPVARAPAPAPAGPVAPDTPAGKTLAAWLAAFNSGDAARMKAFADETKAPPQSVDAGFRAQTGGFELVSIEHSEPRFVRFVVKEKASPTRAVGRITVAANAPTQIEAFQLRAIPRGMSAQEMQGSVDAATRTRVIDGIAAKLAEYYVYPETAKKMEADLRQRQTAGAYDAVTDAEAFAALLTEHLQAVSRDKHLRVVWTPQPLPEVDAEPSADDKARAKQQLEDQNCFFEKAEKLEGDIGYLKLNGFADAAICGPKATAAFAAIGNVKALIVDLRDNGGGQPEMVAYVSSYLFAKRTHLNDLYDRKENKTTQHWTKPGVPGTKLAKQPVYVLTSSRTFSGAEEFTYNLKNLKRATIIGETTGGGAHPTTMKRVDPHFAIGVPFARAINPITKKNWEGTGVEPDVKVPAAEALETAKQLAAKHKR